MEPLSRQRQQLILEMKLCSTRDMRRCRHRVRRLSRDLPAFDFLWLDALVQLRKLTPFQARILDSPHPEKLRVGPCILCDQLGHGIFATTYIARQQDSADRYVVKLISDTPESKRTALENLQRLAARSQDVAHPSLALPHAADEYGEYLVAVSRFVTGPHIGELLVRRGRFPSDVVLEIGRQLTSGLAFLEGNGLVHGDLCLSNVRLTKRGRCVLVDAGVAPAVRPVLSIHAGLPPERYDGIAPELIDTGTPPNSVSDVYALGCLLWQLLAGRPPYTTGDPLAKLSLHQTHTIPDVRTWAPDTPSLLAETISACTARDPSHRPQGFRELSLIWGRPAATGQRKVARFRARFQVSAPSISQPGDRHAARRWTILTSLVLVLSTAAVLLVSPDRRMQLLRLGGFGSQSSPAAGLNEGPGSGPEAADPTNVQISPPPARFLPLPLPGADGTIDLDSNGPYLAGEPLVSEGPIRVLGSTDRHPEIVIGDRPLSVSAHRLVLENVHVRISNERDPAHFDQAAPLALVLAQVQNLVIRRCSFRTHPLVPGSYGDEPRRASANRPIAVAWKTPETGKPGAARLSIEDTMFVGDGAALHLQSYPTDISCANSLRLGRGPLFQISAPASEVGRMDMTLQNVTLRSSGALLRWAVLDKQASRVGLAVTLKDCVLEPYDARTGLFELVGRRLRPEFVPSIQVLGAGSLAEHGLVVLVTIDPQTGHAAALDSKNLQLEGISTGPFQFAGEISLSPRDSEIESYSAPRRTSTPPGIVADRLRMPW